ncbi:MAG: hypothetical protein ABSA03_08980 [Streptosporangiaceae bacterium]|jgi:hypothetical protein
MPSRIATKVITAAVVALTAELTDLALDKAGLSAKKYRLARKILKASVAAATGAAMGKILPGASGESGASGDAAAA